MRRTRKAHKTYYLNGNPLKLKGDESPAEVLCDMYDREWGWAFFESFAEQAPGPQGQWKDLADNFVEYLIDSGKVLRVMGEDDEEGKGSEA